MQQNAAPVTQKLCCAGGTFGGNALGCAAAVAVLDTIQDENLLKNASERGSQLAQVDCRGFAYMILAQTPQTETGRYHPLCTLFWPSFVASLTLTAGRCQYRQPTHLRP